MNSLGLSSIILIVLSIISVGCTSKMESKSAESLQKNQFNNEDQIETLITKPEETTQPTITEIKPDINIPTTEIKPEELKPLIKPIKPTEVYSVINSWPDQVKQAVHLEQTKGYKRPTRLPNCKDLQTMTQHFGCSVAGNNGLAADVKIYLADPNFSLKRVAFILAPHNFENPNSINKEARATALLNGADSIYTDLVNKGISIAFVAYGYKDYYLKSLKAKSSATIKAINLVNSLKNDESKSLLMGLSLGGVIGRMSLRELELQGKNHDISHYISFDSPHRGAHVSVGMQHLMRFLKLSTQHASNKARNFRKYFGGFMDEILNLHNLSNQLDSGIEAGQFISNQVKLFSDVFLDSTFAQELIIQQISQDKNGYYNNAYINSQNYLNSIGMPRNTKKNIGISNGSLNGNSLPLKGDYYVALNTPIKNYIQIEFKSYITKSPSPYVFNGVLKYPDPSELGGLFGGSGTDSYTYTYHQQNAYLDLDNGSCGYLNAVGDIEKALNTAVKQHFGAQLDIKNKNMCFIPVASGLVLTKNVAYKNRVTAQDSLFDEIIGGTLNSHHLKHTTQIISGIKRAIAETY